MEIYGISFRRPYKQSGRWQDVFDPVCTRLSEDEHLDVRNISRAL